VTELAQATTHPVLGILIFVMGGLAGAIFYLPLNKVKKWAWESYWLIYAIFGLILVPWALAFTTSPNVLSVLRIAPTREVLYCFLCGIIWGFGGLTFGLMIRYLGFGLGLATGIGLCSAAGTLVPKMLKGEFYQLFQPGAGIVSFIGVVVSIIGIVLVGMAGMSREKELPEEEKKKAVAEYNFKKGIALAVFCGLTSSAMNFGLQGGPNIEKLAQQTAPVTSITWRGMPVLVVVLLGGFIVNALWCLYLNAKNKTEHDYVNAASPLVLNMVLAGLAGFIWCMQFICFKTGEPAMGKTAYVGWAVLMASSILFSSIIGIVKGEWKGTSSKTRLLLGWGLVLLLGSAVVAAYSGKLAERQSAPQTAVIHASARTAA
jgi:L-rhamnose-H+ transport protein